MTKVVYSGHITAGGGFSGPVAFPGPTGWTVDKMGQTEIYKITHNLHLTLPSNQLHVVVTPQTVGLILSVTAKTADSFTVSVQKPDLASTESAFDFVAIYYKPPLKG